jgi:DNA repair protein RecO (recombination protein O)
MLSKEKGIVLSSKNISESDVLITLLGGERPKQKYKISGLKKSKRRPIVAAELGSYISIDFYEHREKEVFHIKEVSVLNRFDKFKSSYNGYLVLSYISELGNSLLPEGVFQPKCFELYLAALEELNEYGFVPVFLPFFKARLLALFGHIPREYVCHFCGESVITKKNVYLNPGSFEATCSDCGHAERNDREVLLFLGLLFQKKFSLIKLEHFTKETLTTTDVLLSNFIRASLHLNLKSAELLYDSLGPMS